MSEPKQIILEKHYDDEGVYLGMSVVYQRDLTPEFIDALKADLTNKMMWKKEWKAKVGIVEAFEDGMDEEIPE